jgi:hypothetical protein
MATMIIKRTSSEIASVQKRKATGDEAGADPSAGGGAGQNCMRPYSKKVAARMR